jgi:16S rRNA processing protein RimM
VLRIQPADPEGAEVLVPFVQAYVDAVDLAGRRISVDWEADY